ncbi:MAG TPA: hypothetical protein VFH71_13205 [Rhodanobacteraceae bacterium]|nr:hypothetical protein [Rhodanobacteraceae bacterium]
MIHTKKGIALAVGALIFSAAQAQVATKDCTGCSTAQIEALASNCSSGYSYITDFASQNLYKVCFTWDVNDEYRPPRKEKDYDWAISEPQAGQIFKAYEDVYLNNGHVKAAAATLKINIQAPNPLGDNGWMNAYDTVQSSQNENAVQNYLMTYHFSSADFTQSAPALAAGFAELLKSLQITTPVITINNFPTTVTLTFNDGSKRTYTFDSLHGTYVPTPGTAMDAHGNTIPENTSMATNNGIGQYYGFNGGNTYDMGNIETILRNLQAAGIPITNGGGNEIACSSVAGGGVSCRVYHQF